MPISEAQREANRKQNQQRQYERRFPSGFFSYSGARKFDAIKKATGYQNNELIEAALVALCEQLNIDTD